MNITAQNFKNQNQEEKLKAFETLVENFDPQNLMHSLAEHNLYIQIIKFRHERYESLNEYQHKIISNLLSEMNKKKLKGWIS